MNSIRYLFALFPPFALGDGLNNLALLSTWSLIESKTYTPRDWDITGFHFMMLGWETVVYLGATIAYEYISAIPSVQALISNTPIPPTDDSLKDEDVLAEEERLRSGEARVDLEY
jgi:hypothetical protein